MWVEKKYDILVWGLAAGVGLFLVLSEPNSTATRYWGWLYIVVAAGGVFVETQHLLAAQRNAYG